MFATRLIKGRTAAAVLAAVAGALALAACGNSGNTASGSNAAQAGTGSGSGTCVNVASSQCVKVKTPIHMAYFAFGTGDSWGTANADEIKRYAAAKGVDITVFDPAFDPNKQFQQIQAALQSKKYNAFGIVAIDNNLVCNAMTKTAPAEGIVSVAENQPLCGRGVGPDTSQYAPPGSLTFIGNSNVSSGLSAWLNDAAKENPGPQKVIVVTGVATDGITQKLNTLLKSFKASHPTWQFVGQAATDYSSAKGYSATQNLLNAHPDATLLLSPYADTTIGDVRAIAQAGKTGQVKVVDDNGDQATVNLVCSGKIEFTIPEVPRWGARAVVDAELNAFAGHAVPRYINTPQPVITKANACGYKAEY